MPGTVTAAHARAVVPVRKVCLRNLIKTHTMGYLALPMVYYYNGNWVCAWGAPRAVYQFVRPGVELLETSTRTSHRAPGVVVCEGFWGLAVHRSER